MSGSRSAASHGAKSQSTESPPAASPVVARPRLSVAMIVRNAADLLPASLASVQSIADEIVVADTGSTDRTREIAAASATCVIDLEWSDDFAAARNACLAHTTGDWVLWLDAGETISPAESQALRALVDARPSADKAYRVMVQVPAAGHELAAEQIGRIRLHPRRQAIEFTGRVREEIQTAIAALGITIEVAPFALERSARDHEPDVKRAKAERDVHLAAIEIQEHGPLPSPLLAMADACVALGYISQGIEFYSRALELSPRGSTSMLEAFYGILAALDRLPQARDKQLALCKEALDIYPFDAQLLSAMGSYLQQQGRIDLACRSFEAAARFGQVDPQTWHLVEIADMATICQVACQELLGEVDAARRTLSAAAAAKPQSQRLRRQLLEFYTRHDFRKEALDLVGQMPSSTPNREALRSAVRGACLAAKQNWIAALAYLQTAFGSGCRDAICLRGLVTAYIANGDLASAERTVAVWRAAEPNHPEALRLAADLARRRNAAAEDGQAGGNAQAPSPTGDRRVRLDVQPQAPAPVAARMSPRHKDRAEANLRR